MPKVSYKIITLAAAALFVLSACGGGGSQIPPAVYLSALWSFTTSSGVVGQLALNQQGAQITGSMSAPNYFGSGQVPGMGNPLVVGTLNGNSLQGTITGSYGPIACGPATINIGIVISLTGTVSSDGNSLAGQFVTEPTTCFSGNSGNWSAARM